MTRRCDLPARTLPPCDLEWGHQGRMHSNRGVGFYVDDDLQTEHVRRQAERAKTEQTDPQPHPQPMKPRGIPYTTDEVEKALRLHAMDNYHRDLMQWMLERIRADERLHAHLKECPLGWHNDRTITIRSTTDADVVAWLQKLDELVEGRP